VAIRIALQTEDFDLGKVHARLRDNPRCGALVTFTGLVRDLAEGGLKGLTLEHYPGMTEKALHQIAEDACTRWPIGELEIVHRVGRLGPNEQIVLVAVSSSHRGDAFAAAEFVMDYLKTRAPFWKKEHTVNGDHWVEARGSDDQAASRWRPINETDH
jgi:molybdopterin synthase catalytic subunit